MAYIAIAATGGAVLLLLVGACLSTLSTRRTIARTPETFRCKLQRTGRRAAKGSRGWPRTASRGKWVHDSLVLTSGMIRSQVQTLPVRFAEGSLDVIPALRIRGLGHEPLVLALQLDDGTQALLAAPRSAAPVLAGPYLVAHVTSS